MSNDLKEISTDYTTLAFKVWTKGGRKVFYFIFFFIITEAKHENCVKKYI